MTLILLFQYTHMVTSAPVRHRRVISALGLLMVLAPLGAYWAPTSGDAPSTTADGVADYVERWRSANAVPGAAVAVIDGGETTVHLSGVDGDGNELAIDTGFLIGSVAKTFTSTLILQHVTEGRIALDEPAATYLDWWGAEDVSVRMLLTHTSGLTAADGLAVSERYTTGDHAVEAAARDLAQSGTAGVYEYSSANYLMLGAIIEAVSGRSYAAELTDQVLEPLGMEATAATAADAAGPAPGHRIWSGRWARAYDVRLDDSGAPYGYVMSTLEELATYAEAHLNGGLVDDELRSLAWSMQERNGVSSGYGFGWRVEQDGDSLVVHHTGATPGYFAHLWLVPEEDRAVIVLANAYSEARAPSLVAAAADISAITAGGSRHVSAGEPLLTWLPAGLLVLGLSGIAAGVALGAGRLGRWWLWACLAAIVITAVVLAPVLIGATWRTIGIWTPDLYAGLLAAGSGCGFALLAALTRFRRPQGALTEPAPDAHGDTRGQ
ncbi:serine hydrolase domain-containing protein [Microbacterium sp.]|uniref:serine hydrolase domain-containing protein n=1 Tax=Microbacterium sp. TaxID=51671 RepID=UPI002811C624|nr:serine hydrolase domain-containing protein [Microbacterium sp.]